MILLFCGDWIICAFELEGELGKIGRLMCRLGMRGLKEGERGAGVNMAEGVFRGELMMLRPCGMLPLLPVLLLSLSVVSSALSLSGSPSLVLSSSGFSVSDALLLLLLSVFVPFLPGSI